MAFESISPDFRIVKTNAIMLAQPKYIGPKNYLFSDCYTN